VRGFILLLSILLALLGIGFNACRAHADPGTSGPIEQFLIDVHRFGWHGDTAGDGDLVRNGYIVCGMIGDGYSLTQATRRVYTSTDLSVDWNESAQFVGLSVIDLCPQYADTAIA
jgi:hypothetical protein